MDRPSESSTSPFNEGDVREAMGFDRDDERVQVTMIPLGAAPLGGYDIEELLGKFRRSVASDHPENPVDEAAATDRYRAGNEDAPYSAGGDFVNPFENDPKLAALARDPKRHEDAIARLDALMGKAVPVSNAMKDILREAARAMVLHGPMRSGHEGYAVILEEMDELWDHVKGDTIKSAEARKEAIQIAAMAIRLIVDVIEA